MRIIKVFNNNVALVRDDAGDELVVQGRGIAFQARAGDKLDAALIERRFMPEPTGTPEQLAQQVADIPPELLQLAERILSLGPEFDLALDPRATVALADHISIALSRVAAGQKLDNPLEPEVRTLYEREFRLGLRAIEVIREVSSVRLPESEAVSLALHFVNAQAGAQVLSEAVRTAQLIRRILAIIEAEYGEAYANRPPYSEARFATHLRYLFLTHLMGKQHQLLVPQMANSFRDDDPRAYDCASRIAAYIEEKMGWQIGSDETAYMALHIQRMTMAG